VTLSHIFLNGWPVLHVHSEGMQSMHVASAREQPCVLSEYNESVMRRAATPEGSVGRVVLLGRGVSTGTIKMQSN
jgi:hypothetical protein